VIRPTGRIVLGDQSAERRACVNVVPASDTFGTRRTRAHTNQYLVEPDSAEGRFHVQRFTTHCPVSAVLRQIVRRFGLRVPVGRDALHGVSECLLAFFVSKNSAHRSYLGHFDRMAVDAGQNAAQCENILGADEALPVVEVGKVRLAAYICA
jgi:hypothetical protein